MEKKNLVRGVGCLKALLSSNKKIVKMKIEHIQDNIDKISDTVYYSIIDLIVDAVKDYPVYELNDTEDYFNEVKKILSVDEITLRGMELYLTNNNRLVNEKSIWITTSINSFIEAFKLMDLNKISFSDVLNKLEDLK